MKRCADVAAVVAVAADVATAVVAVASTVAAREILPLPIVDTAT